MDRCITLSLQALFHLLGSDSLIVMADQWRGWVTRYFFHSEYINCKAPLHEGRKMQSATSSRSELPATEIPTSVGTYLSTCDLPNTSLFPPQTEDYSPSSQRKETSSSTACTARPRKCAPWTSSRSCAASAAMPAFWMITSFAAPRPWRNSVIVRATKWKRKSRK